MWNFHSLSSANYLSNSLLLDSCESSLAIIKSEIQLLIGKTSKIPNITSYKYQYFFKSRQDIFLSGQVHKTHLAEIASFTQRLKGTFLL